MNRLAFIPPLIGGLTLIASCTEIFEPDLSAESIIVHYPTENDSVYAGSVDFWWQHDFIESFHLQIVKGEFSNPELLMVDTTINQNQFALYLPEGRYNYSIKGVSSTSSSIADSISFWVLKEVNLEGEVIQFYSPNPGDCISKNTLNVLWTDLSIPGTSYDVQLRNGPFADNDLIYSILTDSNGAQFVLNSEYEGHLSIGVRVVNDHQASPFYELSTFYDITTPQAPTPFYPTAGDTLDSGLITFQWSTPVVAGEFCQEIDSLFIYPDSLGVSLPLIKVLDASLGGHSTDLSVGQYSYQIRRSDEAGNQSDITNLIPFVVE